MIDKETASYLTNSGKLQELKKEQFEKYQVYLDPQGSDPCNVWIVCDKAKMDNAEKELTRFIEEKKIASSTFKPMDPMKFRFLNAYCRSKIKKEESRCKAEGVVVQIATDSFEIKGTQQGRRIMTLFLKNLDGKVESKVRFVFARQNDEELIE